ncbi:MAG: RusA family crossover junction endodeoxyribonuclease [Caldilineaceae bacterium]
MLPFEFIVDGPPVSQQTRRRQRLHEWREQVRAEAILVWPPGEVPHAEPVMMSIIYFYDSITMDVDNIAKPISDALIGLVYIDDDQITDCLVRKRNLSGNLRLENPSDALADGFSRGNEFLYIQVQEAPDQEVIR